MITVQMTIQCPTDGQVTVDVSDVNAIVFDRNGKCEISFICPRCGAELRQAVTPVAMQMAIVEPEAGEVVEEALERVISGQAVREDDEDAGPTTVVVDEAVIEAYCEYFRRELADSEDIEAALADFDESGS